MYMIYYVEYITYMNWYTYHMSNNVCYRPLRTWLVTPDIILTP